MMNVASVRAANIRSVKTAVAVAQPVAITSVQVVLIPARPAMTRFVAVVFLTVSLAANVSVAPVCPTKPVHPVSKNPWRMKMPYPKNQPLTRRLLQRPRRKRPKQRKRRPLRFSPYAWAKLIYLRDRGPTEVGGFGITEPDDPRFVTDIILVKQTCTDVTVAFDDAAVADYFDDQIDAGRRPENFGRIWIHTHPGFSARPSQVDVETFARVFGNCDWAVMFILARNGATYAELKHADKPGSEKMSVGINFKPEFAASNQGAWEAEYLECVQEAPLPPLWDLAEWLDDEFTYSEQWPVFPI
tara:strand:- start:314 stop:1213 length:900 start_codon:yes stop_codon:yes gene_type:complete